MLSTPTTVPPFTSGAANSETALRPKSKRAASNVRAHGHDDPVPRISEFYGIAIEMYFADHPPPHFHARYGSEEATIVIASGAVLGGVLPRRALRLVREWLEEHRDELEANWDRARNHEAPVRVAPLT